MNENTTIPLCGLWKAKTKDGMDFLSGTFANVKIMVFRNTRKTEDKQPDYNIVLARKEKPENPPAGNDPIPF